MLILAGAAGSMRLSPESGTLLRPGRCDTFATLDSEHFQRCFVAWAAALTGAPAGVIAMDGKTSRRSYQKTGARAPIHMVSAFAARQRLVGLALHHRPPQQRPITVPHENASATIARAALDFTRVASGHP